MAATTWSVGTKTVKLSSAGFAWVHGNLMAQHGIDICLFLKHNLHDVKLFICNNKSKLCTFYYCRERKESRAMHVVCVHVSGTTAIATTKMTQRQLEMLKR